MWWYYSDIATAFADHFCAALLHLDFNLVVTLLIGLMFILLQIAWQNGFFNVEDVDSVIQSLEVW